MGKNYLLLFLTTFFLVFISVAYAAFNSELTITGEGIIEKDSTPPTCGSWYLRDSSLTIQEAYDQNKFINPADNTSWTTTNKKLFIECSDNMEGSYGCINVTEITDSNSQKRYYKEVKEYIASIKTDSEAISVTLTDAYENQRTCTLPVGGSNPYIDKQGPKVTITQSDYNKFTYIGTDDLEVKGYMVTTSPVTPDINDPNWIETPTEVTIDNTEAKTYYVWIKDGVNITNETISTYLLTKTTGTGTTLTLKHNNNSGAELSSGYVLYGTNIYVLGNLKTGYNALVLTKGETNISNQSVQIVNGATTITSSATSNKYTVKYNANGGTGNMQDQSMVYNKNYVLSTNSFTRRGYYFNGWNTATNGSGTSYTDKESISNLSSTNGDVITLYAQWQRVMAENVEYHEAEVNCDDSQCMIDELYYMLY